jgi:hypothetical protein
MANLIDLDDFINDLNLWDTPPDDDDDDVFEQEHLRAGVNVRINRYRLGTYNGIVRVTHHINDPMCESFESVKSYDYTLSYDSRLEVIRKGEWVKLNG